jgi:hypothetical protein
MSTPSDTFTEMVSTTLRNHDREIVDNVIDHNGFLRYLKARGNIKTKGGGYEIVMPISYAENQTYQRYYGGDTLDIRASDVITSVKYDWKQIALHVTANGRELRMNNSKEKMIDLVNSRMDVAKSTAANNLSVDIYSDGSLTNQVGGLSHLISADGTGTVGGIVAGTWTFWKNKFQEISTDATAYANVRAAMNKQWLATTVGTESPDVIILTHDLYTVYEGGLQDNQRYADASSAALGFQALKFKTANVIFDDNANYGTTAELGYFINTKYMYMVQHPEAQWSEGDRKTPLNQDAVVVPIYWMGNLVTTNRSRLGRIHDLA